jgi:hypothetical protein
VSTLRISLEAAKREALPGDVDVVATITNAGDAPAPFHRSHAERSSLALQVEDARGERVLLPPPSPPGERDLAPPSLLAPGESFALRYSGFLDARLRAGRYRVRWFSTHEALGGTRDAPLASDWIDIDVSRPREPRMWDLVGRPWRYVLTLARWIVDLVARRLCRAVLQKEVDVPLVETIADGTPSSWNGTYGWNARFHVLVDQPQQRIVVTLRVRLVGTAPVAAWVATVENAWSKRFKDCATRSCASNGYPIHVVLAYVASNEHHQVSLAPNRTASMLQWGLVDTDQAHEAGHMLGNKEEYFTIDGVPFGQPYQPAGNIMNNPLNPPAAKHYWLVQKTVDDLLGVNYSLSGGSTRPVDVPCNFA